MLYGSFFWLYPAAFVVAMLWHLTHVDGPIRGADVTESLVAGFRGIGIMLVALFVVYAIRGALPLLGV